MSKRQESGLDYIQLAAVSPDGRLYAIGSRDGKYILVSLNPDTGYRETLAELETGADFWAMCCGPEGSIHLLEEAGEQVFHLFRLDSRGSVFQSTELETSAVSGVADMLSLIHI